MTPTGWHWFGTPEGAAALIIGCDGRSLGLRYREFFESVVRAAAEIDGGSEPVRCAGHEDVAAGIDCEVIDMRSLVPLDAATVLESLGRTGRLFTVEENPRVGGWGAEIVALVADEGFEGLALQLGDFAAFVELPEPGDSTPIVRAGAATSLPVISGLTTASPTAMTSSWSTKLISTSSWVNSGWRSARKSSSR